MGLHWGAPVLKSLLPDDWWNHIQSVQVDPHVPTKEQDTLIWLRGDSGKTIAEITFGPFYRLRRSKLREMLFQGLDIRFGKRLRDITYANDRQSVTAHFHDGTSVIGSQICS